MGCAPSTNWCRISSIHCSYGKSMNMTILYRTLIYKLPNASWSTYIYIYVCVGLKMVFTLQMTILMEMIIIYWNWGYPTFSDKPKKRQGLALNITRFLLIIQIPIGQKRGKTFKNHRIWQSNNCSCQSFHSGRSVRYLHNVAPPR